MLRPKYGLSVCFHASNKYNNRITRENQYEVWSKPQTTLNTITESHMKTLTILEFNETKVMKNVLNRLDTKLQYNLLNTHNSLSRSDNLIFWISISFGVLDYKVYRYNNILRVSTIIVRYALGTCLDSFHILISLSLTRCMIAKSVYILRCSLPFTHLWFLSTGWKSNCFLQPFEAFLGKDI